MAKSVSIYCYFLITLENTNQLHNRSSGVRRIASFLSTSDYSPLWLVHTITCMEATPRIQFSFTSSAVANSASSHCNFTDSVSKTEGELSTSH